MISLISDYRVKSGEEFLVDTNVWLFLFAPIGLLKRDKQQAYSGFVEYIRSNKGVIILPAAILSEIANRLFGDAYAEWSKNPANAGMTDRKKYFIPSAAYKNYLAFVRSVFESILQIARKFPDDFNSIDLRRVIKDMDSCSFADAYYLAYARQKKLTILTDDGDLKRLSDPKQQIVTFKL